MPTVRRSPDAWDNCRAWVLRCEDCRGRGIQPTPRPVKVVDRSPLDWETRVTFRRYRPDSRRERVARWLRFAAQGVTYPYVQTELDAFFADPTREVPSDE
jgi:hypothetical protein